MTDATTSGYTHSGRPFPRTNWLAYGLGPPAARSIGTYSVRTAARITQPAGGAFLVRVQSLLVSPGAGGSAARAMLPARRYPGVDGRAANPEAAPPY